MVAKKQKSAKKTAAAGADRPNAVTFDGTELTFDRDLVFPAGEWRSAQLESNKNTSTVVDCPQSATHAAVAFSGLLGFLIGIFLMRYYRPFDEIAYSCMFVMGAIAVGIFLPDLLWQRVYARPSAGLRRVRPAPSWNRSLTKFAGLIGSISFVGLLYWLFPEYGKENQFRSYFLMIKTILPVWLLLAIPYIYLVDRRMEEPEDGFWQMGRLVTLQWSGLNLPMIGQHLLGWLVKGFFLPLMFTYMCRDMEKFLSYDLAGITSFKDIYDFFFFFYFFIDVGLISMTYLFTTRLTDTHIRSTEPTMLGWIVAIMCYEPFWSLISRQYVAYQGQMVWGGWLWEFPVVYILWGSIILVLIAVYVWATVSFGGRFSNLTHRGIITNGPYRFTKHPAYIAKNLSWWLISVPFLVSESAGESLRRCLLLLLVNLIYYFRAKTEERHLSRDPIYVQYSKWMDRHGIFSFIPWRSGKGLSENS